MLQLGALERDLSPELRSRLSGIRGRAVQHIRMVENVVERAASARAPEHFSEVLIRDLVLEAVEHVHELSDEYRRTIEVGRLSRHVVLVPRGLVLDALVELLRNAVEADRGPDRRGLVTIAANEERGDTRIDVIDDGTGIAGWATAAGRLADIAPTKGRPAEGLVTVEAAIKASRGRIEIVTTGPTGTQFSVWLSDRVSGVRRSPN